MKIRRSNKRRANRSWSFQAATGWIEGCLIFAGMMSWTASRAIPIEFCWSSAAGAQLRFL